MTDQQKTDLDHAELGRLAEAAEADNDNPDYWAAVRSLEAFNVAANPKRVLALLSDNAALTASRDAYREQVTTMDLMIAALRSERDEAVALLRLFDMHLGDDDAMWTDGSTVSSEWIRPDGIRQSLTFGLFRQVRTFLQSIARETGK